MKFNKINFESMKLGDDVKVSQTYIRQVEEDSRLTQFIWKTSEKEVLGIMPKVPDFSKKDFLETALENCQKFNEELEGTFD